MHAGGGVLTEGPASATLRVVADGATERSDSRAHGIGGTRRGLFAAGRARGGVTDKGKRVPGRLKIGGCPYLFSIYFSHLEDRIMRYPDHLEFLEFFGVEPSVENGVYGYRVEGPAEVALVFSFNINDDSVQTSLSIQEQLLSSVCQEGLVGMWIENESLHGRFESGDYRISLLIAMQPSIRVEWAGLRYTSN